MATTNPAEGGTAAPQPDTQCKAGETPGGFATAVLVLVIMGLSVRLAMLGLELRRRPAPPPPPHPDQPWPPPSPPPPAWPAVAVAVVLLLGGGLYYLQQYRRCNSLQGFLVYLLIAGVANVVVVV